MRQGYLYQGVDKYPCRMRRVGLCPQLVEQLQRETGALQLSQGRLGICLHGGRHCC